MSAPLHDVADEYRRLLGTTTSPALAIATSRGVPVRTVHSWLYRARKAGLLKPTTPGHRGIVGGYGCCEPCRDSRLRERRLDQLLADIASAAFAAPAEGWLTDELWSRIVSEVPGAPIRSTTTDEGEALW